MILIVFREDPGTARLTPDFASVIRISLSHFDVIRVARWQEDNGGGGSREESRYNGPVRNT